MASISGSFEKLSPSRQDGATEWSVASAQSLYQQVLSKVSLLELDARLAAITAIFIAHKLNVWELLCPQTGCQA
ncbi:hypothetical protein WJX84_002110 [Apatococcus fuscideae]|uniref:Uncharacterized protein n=1 Tax=Apatococcus fuscideae TaxID=2026836 RepID=A0AAW1RE82_9CHLO